MRVRAKMDITFETSRGIVTVRKGETFRPSDPARLIRQGLAEPIPPDSAGKPQAVRVWSEVLGENIWLVLVPGGVAYVRDGGVCYTPEEIKGLKDATREEIRAVHWAKKFMGGNLVLTLERRSGRG
ncbi:MAG: hypothetical protein HZA19_00435 [Nitrospirae bacterium]|nr:hypothetical protein [Nitrospirota bacterium]